MRVARLTLPAPAVEDDPIVCIPINRAWIPVLMGAISRLDLPASWRDGTDMGRAGENVLTLARLLKNAAECEDFMFDVRQHPQEYWRLEKSITGGTVWDTFADLRLSPTLIRLRQRPDVPCNLEWSADAGVSWLTFADIRACAPNIQVVANANAPGGFQIQYSTDGGVTWTPTGVITLDPIGDNPPPQAPQPTEPRCNAARNAMLAYFNLAWLLAAQVDALPHPEPYLAAADFLPVLRDRLNYFIGSPAYNSIVTNAQFAAALTLYLSSVRTAAIANNTTMGAEIRTRTGYDIPTRQSAIQCAFFCAADEDGNIDFGDALVNLQEAVAAGDIAAGSREFVVLLGGGGMAAAASARIGAFDASACADCDDTCFECVTLTIPATADPRSNSTGIQINPFDRIRITASGSINTFQFGPFNGPNGTDGACPSCAIPSAPPRSLAGRIGTDDIFVGSSFNLVWDSSGTLYLGINDDVDWSNNSGSFTVEICIDRA